MSVCQVGQATRDDGLQCFAKSIEKGYWSVCLGLRVVIFTWFPENDRDCLPEVCGTIARLETGVEEPMQAWQENIQRMMEDPVRDAIGAWRLIRRSSSASLHPTCWENGD